MGIEALYPKKNLSASNKQHRIYPYLLRNVKIEARNQVCSTDITYVPIRTGFLYLTAIIDWCSRFVLSWQLTNSLANNACIEALENALCRYGAPSIFNTDQGSQFTAENFLIILERKDFKTNMDGKVRALDNVYSERFWRTLKHDGLYIKDYPDGKAVFKGLDRLIGLYNHRRPHSSLGGRPSSGDKI